MSLGRSGFPDGPNDRSSEPSATYKDARCWSRLPTERFSSSEELVSSADEITVELVPAATDEVRMLIGELSGCLLIAMQISWLGCIRRGRGRVRQCRL